MPMPIPSNDEDHGSFMERCHSEMHEEFPDDAQRNAVCEAQWDRTRHGQALPYGHILNLVAASLWAILPEKLAAIMDLLRYRAMGGRYSAEEIRQRIGAVARPAQSSDGAVAVIPIYGVIVPRGDILAESSGAVSVDTIRAQFRAAMQDARIANILLDVDSPGGTVTGVDELSAEIFRARGQKPIMAIASPLAASAAYWLATAADELTVVPSGEVGSIGVFAVHEDVSRMMDAIGIKTNLISAGKYKVEANPFEPLGDEARAAIQGRVNDYYGMFIDAVARNRGVRARDVADGFGEGRLVGAKQAVGQGMADRIGTIDDAMARLSKAKAPARAIADLGGIFAGPIPSHKSPGIADDDTAWDGPGEVAAADQKELHVMCAWEDAAGPDDDGDGHPDRKGDYKFPHHRHGDHYLVPNGVYACAQRLNQADIPGGDVAGIRRHLDDHYKEMDRRPPWGLELEFRRRRLAARGA